MPVPTRHFLLALLIALLIAISWFGASFSLRGDDGPRATHQSNPTTASSAGPPSDAHPATNNRHAQEEGQGGVPSGAAQDIDRLQIIVQDSRSGAIADAEVFLRIYGDCRFVGKTDGHGIVKAEWRGPRQGMVDAVHRRFAPTSVGFELNAGNRVDKTTAHEIRLIMSDGELLHGAALVGGAPGPAGVGVVAYPTEAGPRELFQPAINFMADAQHLSTVTDNSGQFSLNVDPAVSYNLVVGGNGLVQAAELRAIRSSNSPVYVELEYAFVLPVRFLDESKQPIRFAGHAVKGAGPPSANFEGREGSPGSFPMPAAVLAGLPVGLLKGPEVVDPRMTLFYTSKSATEVVGPILVHGVIPGYAPFHSELWATRISAGSKFVDVQLRSATTGFGMLNVRSTGRLPGDELDSTFNHAFSQYSHHGLYLTDEQELVLRGPLAAWQGNTCQVRSVPAGTYTWQYRAGPNPWLSGLQPSSKNGGRFVLEANGEAGLVVDLDGYGALKLDVTRNDGSPYFGMLPVVISQPLAETVTSSGEVILGFRSPEDVNFPGAPYRIGNLLPQNYVVHVRGAPKEQYVSASVVAGEVQRLRLELP
jgi:hypothetical protein